MTHFPDTHRIALITALLVISLIVAPVAVAQEIPELQITSTQYIVIDADSGDVYAQRNADEEVAIASLTKVFTAVQAMNMASLDTLITTKTSDLKSANATTMGFDPGETYTLRDMIYGLLLPSGNDAAHAIARTLGYQDGDTDDEAVDRFMSLANQRVENMGLTHTHLLNPDGWGVPGHYSSASDVAVMMQYAMEYPFLVDVMGTRQYTTSNGAITVTNSNRLLNMYDPIIAGKTGYDDDSGWCLVNVAGTGNARMIAVTLDGISDNRDWYDDNQVLLQYGFNQKSELANTGEPFSGDVLSYRDPDIAQLANTGKQQAEINGEPSIGSGLKPPPSRGKLLASNEDSTPMEFMKAGPGLALTAAVALVGIRGALSWRNLEFRRDE